MHRYTVLDNRTLVVQRIPVSEDTYRLLRDEFARRHVVQDQHLRAQEAMAGDGRLLAALLAHRNGRAPVDAIRLEGVGFFFEEARPPDPRTRAAREPDDRDGITAPTPALVALRTRVAEAYGATFIDESMGRIVERLLALTPDEQEHPPRDLSAERSPSAAYGFSERYEDLFVSLLALEALRDARSLRLHSVTGASGSGPALEAEDRDLVARLGDALASSLVRLLRSSRPDWGFPLLVGMARLVALDETARADRWMFLDAFATDADVIPAAQIVQRPALARALADEAREDLAAALAHLRARGERHAGFPEADFVALEAAGNRLIEIRRTIEEHRPMRLAPGRRVPSRDAVLVEPIVPAITAEALARHASRARELADAYETELRRLYPYNVVTQNCVTEIFRTIDAALARTLANPDAAAIRRESTARLGGQVDVEHTLTFIPAASALAVRDAYAVAETVEVPSYRLAALAGMYRHDNPARVYLRESNTLTSTLYHRNPADSAFLFFTDDVVALRPLLGAANLVAGLGVSAAGVFALPVDGGDLLRAGLKGVLFSLPELSFFNIRKGSLPFSPRGPYTPR